VTAPDEPHPKRRGRPSSGGREAILAATLELLHERGVANLTTREVAARAGVSEASIYYHFNDRPGLLKAVFADGMKPLEFLAELAPGASDRRAVIANAAQALTAFFTETVPVIVAAQADPGLGASLAEYVAEHDLGAHKGVSALGDFLRAEQAAGRVNADADVEAVALMLIETCFGIVAVDQWMGDTSRLPSLDRVVDEVNRLLD
jgi:AcrR family transcriptional regulator